MDKQQIISFIEGQLAAGTISPQDLTALAAVSSSKKEPAKNLINVFYAIGAIIAVIGVIILIAQNWREIGFFGRVLSTLGISVVTYIAGLLSREPAQDKLAQIMFVISAALAPLGCYVLLNEASIDFTSGVQILTSGILALLFATALFVSKKNILTLITVFFGTWMYYAVVVRLFDYSYSFDVDVLKWATMLLGASYLLLGYGYHKSMAVKNVMYGFGTLAILGAGISIGGMFDLLFILFIFAAFYGSVYLKSRAMLVLAALFLMAHLIKLTSEYFVDSIGWPVALILVGFLVIGIGYGTFYVNRKFISN